MLLVKVLCGIGFVGLIAWLLMGVFSEYVGGPAKVLDAGHILIQGRVVQLLGVDAPATHQPCRFAGETWLCGLRAARELSGWLSDRIVRCIPEGHAPSGEPLGLCYAGADDVGRWIVEQGWGLADARGSTRYITVEQGARARLAGLWRSEFTVPRVWRAAHGSLTRGSEFGNREAAVSDTPGRPWRPLILIGGILVCASLLLRWVPPLRPRIPGLHVWRIRRSRHLLHKLRRIGRERGPGAQFAYLRKVDPFLVEELVLTAFVAQGHRIRRNLRYTGDGGIDGRCWIDGRLHLIQVKRYGRYIKSEDVRAFCQLCKQANAAGLFIHTGRTGPGAARATTPDVRMISGARLLQILDVSHTQQEFAQPEEGEETPAGPVGSGGRPLL